MELTYKKAGTGDLDMLVETRIEVLLAANKLDSGTDMSEVRERSYDYYAKALENGTHTAYLVFDGEMFVGCGGISYYTVMPTYHNTTGQKAYIMNMYTKPGYRRKGIAAHTLELLVRDARERGVTAISLEATDMGRKLYESFGFKDMKHEMELPEDTDTAVTG